MGDDPYTMKDVRGSMNFDEIQEALKELKEKMSVRSKERAPKGTPDLSTDESDDDEEQEEQEEETEEESDVELKPWKVNDYHIEPPEPPENLDGKLRWTANDDFHVSPPTKNFSTNFQNAGISHKDLSNLAQKRVDVSVDVEPDEFPTSGSEIRIGGQEHTIEYDDEGNVQFVKKPSEDDDSEPEPDREYGCSGCGTSAYGHGVMDEHGSEYCSVSCLNESITDE